MTNEELQSIVGDYSARHVFFKVEGSIATSGNEIRLQWKSCEVSQICIMRTSDDIYERVDEQLFDWWREFMENNE